MAAPGAPAAAAKPAAKNAAKTVNPSIPKRAPDSFDLLDEKTAIARFERLRTLVKIQTWALCVLGLLLVGVVPLSRPYYNYYAMTPDQRVKQMVPLTMPNMTNRAVLSWATTAITEVMTMGFGDIGQRLPKQRWRFTEKGWEVYYRAFIKARIAERFRQNQLVLTTVPSNTPVIISQGVNDDDIYQWVVQMPVIMTYATNNNVTIKEHGFATLTIVRVPGEVSSAGIAIHTWMVF